jgi:hypothetical protein
MVILQPLKVSLIHSAPQLAHHALQPMLVGIHTHIKSAKLERQ